jgi:hypothetical protein
MWNDGLVTSEPRVNRRQLLIGAGAAGAAAAAGLATSVTPVAAASGDSWVVGAWDITVTPNGGPPFPGVITFSEGGTVTSVDGNNAVASAGGWKSDDDRIDLTFRNFELDSQGNLQAIVTVNSTVKPKNDGTALSGKFKVTVTDPSGQTVLFSGTGSVTGTRLAIHGA